MPSDEHRLLHPDVWAERLREEVKIYDGEKGVQADYVVPEPALPVFSVGTQEEARRLIVLACPMGYEKQKYYVPGVLTVREFSDKLEKAHTFLAKAGRCECVVRRQMRLL